MMTSESPPREGASQGWTVKWIGIAVFAVAVVVYSLSWWGDFVLDDTVFLVSDQRISEPSQFHRIWTRSHWDSPRGNTLGAWRPVGLTSLAVTKWISGDRAWPHHVVNTLLHGGVSFLVVILVWQIGRNRGAAAVAGLLFAVHPIHTEAVANVMGRLELLAALFALLAWWSHRRGKWAWTPLWLLLAVLSKESAITMVGVFALDDLLGRPGVDGGRRRILAAWSVIAAALVLYFVVRWGVLGTFDFTRREPSALILNPLLGEHVGLITRWATAIGVLGRQWWVFVWPVHLAADHSWSQIPLTTSLFEHPASTAGMFLLFLGIFAAMSWRKNPAVTLAIGFWACTASLTSNLIMPVGVLYAERLLYLPSLGFCLLVGLGAARALRRSGDFKPAIIVLIVIMLAAASVRTVRRTWDWGNSLRLWTHDVQVVPRASHAWFNLGIWLQFDDQFEAAREAYWLALDLSRPAPDPRVPPQHQRCLRVLMPLLIQLLDSAKAAGNEAEAAQLVDELQTALGYAFAVEVTPEVLSFRGRLAQEQGDLELAEECHERALAAAPSDRTVLTLAGEFFESQGDLERAIGLYRRAGEVDPTYARVQFLLGRALLANGEVEEVQIHLHQAEALRTR